jgi:transcriptional regulator CtsR
MSRSEYLMHFFQAVGKSLGEADAAAYLRNLVDHGIMTEREGKLAMQALTEAALDACPPEKRDGLRAEIFRRMLMIYMM